MDSKESPLRAAENPSQLIRDLVRFAEARAAAGSSGEGETFSSGGRSYYFARATFAAPPNLSWRIYVAAAQVPNL
eukprot:tig00020629_g12449.t1